MTESQTDQQALDPTRVLGVILQHNGPVFLDKADFETLYMAEGAIMLDYDETTQAVIVKYVTNEELADQ
jgi:hypothetical protein